MKSIKIVGALISAVVLTVFIINGCAAIFKGSSEGVDFGSDPSGAQVYINGSPRGTTPCKIMLASKGTYVIEFKKEGYNPQTYTITNHVGAGWIILDVLLTGLIGVVVDATTGAWYELDSKYVNMILEKQQ